MNGVDIGRGQSFKGLSNYLLHDELQQTAERVGAAWTCNMGSNIQPEKAWLHMLWTYNSADALKAAAGARRGGAKNEKPVYHYSLNFNPADNPTADQMHRAVAQSMDRLGLGEHQALAVEHRDKDHAHVHVMVNLVHPEDGKTAALSYSHRKLSTWAAEFEDAEGLVVTAGRRENQKRREQGEKTSCKRKTRNAYKAAAANDDFSFEFAQADERGQLAKLLSDGRDLEAKHGRERRVLDTNFTDQTRAADRVREKLIKKTTAEVKQGMKPQWAALFRQHEAQNRGHEATENTLLGLFSNMVTTYRLKVREGHSPLAALDAAMSSTGRRAHLDQAQFQDRMNLAARQRQEVKEATKTIRATSHDYKTGLRADYFRQLAQLKTAQAAEQAEIKARWRALNDARGEVEREMQERRERRQQRQAQGQRRGMGYRYAMRPNGPRR
ncbi:relaxase/mobilization nuclease domain-containing protein [Jiella avicenniae]|uniref:Relaxase/mobilization nuclease domain-containing protein n=1 Tax=Jiella avicenniae TaxID=2907202 RepID=A0A9X1P3W7_9HYPH|nr:relaxase/mobilization nuclease domain-containing protein [Jiella avicenniae]MCE7030990.1 relaxase/mobilization nuclease domain-containing protein [Jiella avicenniae]